MPRENQPEFNQSNPEADAVGELAEQNELIQTRLLEIKQELNALANDPTAMAALDYDQRVEDLTEEYQALHDLMNLPNSVEKLNNYEKDIVMRRMFASKTTKFEQ